MSRQLITERTYVQIFMSSKVFVSSSGVQKSLRHGFHAFKITFDQNFVLSKRKFVRSNFENSCLLVQTIMRLKTTMSRLSCVKRCVCLDFRAFCPEFLPFFYISCSQRFYNVFISGINIIGVMVLMKCPAFAIF